MKLRHHLAVPALIALSTTVLAAEPASGVDSGHPKADHGHKHAVSKMTLPAEAVAVLIPMQDSGVKGTLVLTQKDGYVLVEGKVTGLTPGKHGFHIHEFGDLRDPAGKSAGGHYNPEGHPHGGPGSSERHAGDLGNITADENGVAEVNVKAEGLELHLVIGRSFVVHAKEDDLKSQPSGDAGDRIAVGVIGLSEVESEPSH